ncbi:hypothetical protein SAMN05216414_1106 [Nitrosovibrio sp. Nv17]|nr:hypothetical protein SAMN05216414_1106 [Nitrosovibrio sp. Nv17]
MLLESVEPLGVRTVRLSKCLENYQNDDKPYLGGLAIIRHKKADDLINRNRENLIELARYAVDQFGYPYDRGEIAKIAVRILTFKVLFTRKQLKKSSPIVSSSVRNIWPVATRK